MQIGALIPPAPTRAAVEFETQGALDEGGDLLAVCARGSPNLIPDGSEADRANRRFAGCGSSNHPKNVSQLLGESSCDQAARHGIVVLHKQPTTRGYVVKINVALSVDVDPADWAAINGQIVDADGRFTTKDVRDDLRAYVLNSVQQLALLDETGADVRLAG